MSLVAASVDTANTEPAAKRDTSFDLLPLSRAGLRGVWSSAGGPTLIGGLVLLGVLVALSLAAPLFGSATHMYADGLAASGLPLPVGSPGHLLGTDSLGRDMLARSVHGLRTTLTIAVVANITSLAVGTIVGLVAGYYRGWVEQVLMRIVDIFLSVPTVLSGLAIASIIGSGAVGIIVVVTALYWAWTARLVHGETARLRSRGYVDAARLARIPGPVIIGRHILPHMAGLLLNLGALNGAAVIVVGAGLSYLGAGIQLPTPELGTMLADSSASMVYAPHILLVPLIFTIVAVLAFVLVGEGLGRRGTEKESVSWLSA
jgi:ABC-type dipeptide/oligopeptide/nickel transport system permease subunit